MSPALRKTLLVGLGAAALAAGLPLSQAAAATATTSFSVTAEVVTTCAITATNMNFGNYSGVQLDATATLNASVNPQGSATTVEFIYGTDAMLIMMRLAFDKMNLHRLYLDVHDYNSRAIASYEKCGFKREAVLREHHFRHGKYCDTIVMGILESEYRALP